MNISMDCKTHIRSGFDLVFITVYLYIADHCVIHLSIHAGAVIRFARYTVLTSPNKDETAVHGYGPTLSVLVLLVSLKLNFFK